MNKRQLLAAGLVAGISGAGVAWWRLQPHAVAPSGQAAFWAAEFTTPDEQPLRMADFKGRPLLLNFWATWCPPCVEELPMLSAFYDAQQAAGWQVVGLAIDQPSAVRQFLVRQPLSFPVGLAGLSGTEWGKQLGNTNGGLPFSVLFNANGDVVHQKLGQLKPEDLVQWRTAV